MSNYFNVSPFERDSNDVVVRCKGSEFKMMRQTTATTTPQVKRKKKRTNHREVKRRRRQLGASSFVGSSLLSCCCDDGNCRWLIDPTRGYSLNHIISSSDKNVPPPPPPPLSSSSPFSRAVIARVSRLKLVHHHVPHDPLLGCGGCSPNGH